MSLAAEPEVEITTLAVLAAVAVELVDCFIGSYLFLLRIHFLSQSALVAQVAPAPVELELIPASARLLLSAAVAAVQLVHRQLLEVVEEAPIAARVFFSQTLRMAQRGKGIGAAITFMPTLVDAPVGVEALDLQRYLAMVVLVIFVIYLALKLTTQAEAPDSMGELVLEFPGLVAAVLRFRAETAATAQQIPAVEEAAESSLPYP